MEEAQKELQVGDFVMVQYPAYYQESDPKIGGHRIPHVNMKLHQVIKLDEEFAYLKDNGKIERYRIVKIFKDKKVFVCKDYGPLKIIKEDGENLKKEESK